MVSGRVERTEISLKGHEVLENGLTCVIMEWREGGEGWVRTGFVCGVGMGVGAKGVWWLSCLVA